MDCRDDRRGGDGGGVRAARNSRDGHDGAAAVRAALDGQDSPERSGRCVDDHDAAAMGRGRRIGAHDAAAARGGRDGRDARIGHGPCGFSGGAGDVAAFATSHPVVPAVYAVLTLGLTMFSMQPVLIALSLAGGLAFGLAVRGPAATLGGLRWQLPLIVIVALVNPLFSASGSTELFRLGTRAVYLESLVYGACMGGMFVASVLWFEAAGAMLSYDKVMALLGNAAPVVALMISMCMRLIPQFMRRGRDILAVQDAIDVDTGDRVGALCAVSGGGSVFACPGGTASALESASGTDAALDGSGVGSGAARPCRAEADNDAPGQKTHHARAARTAARRHLLASRLRATSVLMGWGMEDSLERADAMRARGWGAAARRTTYVRWRFGARDAAAVAGLVLGGVLTCVVAVVATSQFTFYPVLSTLVPWWGYALYAAWMLLPCALHVLDERRFG